MSWIVVIIMTAGLMNEYVFMRKIQAGVMLRWPVPNYYNSLSQGFHDGNAIDISRWDINGADIVAAIGGTVQFKFTCSGQREGNKHTWYNGCPAEVNRCRGFGTGLVIRGDDGRIYQYAHMQANSIPNNIYVGARVSQGQKIGSVGQTGNATGPHLHFGISLDAYYNASGINPQNETYIDDSKPIVPSSPSGVRLNMTDIGLGDALTVSWNASSGATSYNVNLVCTTDSANNQSKSVSGTSTSFSITKAGSYKVNVSAKNSAGTSSETGSGNCVAHNNVTVRYVDWDDELLKEQSVKWGGNAVAPAAPSREGYTFQNWSGNSNNVTSDVTIKAQYKMNSYSVTFVDYKGDVIGNVQKVEHGLAAIPPTDIPTKEGYVFSEWSTKEYEKVTKALTVKAVYVWENTNLPIITKIVSAKRNDEATGYDIEVKLSNFPNDFTKGKLVATLKTKKGKMVASEIKSISMPTEGEVTEHFTILYSGLAPRVDVSMIGVVDDDTTGTPKSKLVSSAVDIGNQWSDWSTVVPTGDDIISDSRTEYRYKDTRIIKSITQPATPTGYSLINKSATGTYTAWGEWSGWSDTAIAGNALREVQTQSVVKSYKTQYNYSRWASRSNNTGNLGPVKGTWSGVYCQYYFERGWSDSALAVSGSQYSNQVGGYFNLYGNNQWFNQSTRSVAASYKTQYRYRTRSEYCNYTYKQDEFSPWQAEKIESSDTREIETRVAYRFKTNSTEVPCYNYKRYRYTNLNNGKVVYSYTSSYADSMDYPGEWEYKTEFDELAKIAIVDDKIELYNGTGEDSWYKADVNDESNSTVFKTSSSLEDQTGVSRRLEGKVEGAAGKVATLMIYKGKNDDPIASQIEYIGQTVIGEDGSYIFDYVTKEEPTLLTGDFVITLGVEGSTNYVKIGKIEAPKQVYSVSFIDEDGKTIGEGKSVVEGGTVEAPDAPEKPGYEFVGWDTGLRNIRENIVITAQYRKKIYTVIFIDWDQSTVGIREFEYGDILEAPEKTLEKEGQIFDKWVDDLNDEVTTVTKNMIVTASYKDTKYSVKFLDWNGQVISEQEVDYGEEAQAPLLEGAPDKMEFVEWDSQGAEKFVTKDMIISPVAEYIKKSEKPKFTIDSGSYTDAQSIGIYSTKANTDIYYAIVSEETYNQETTGPGLFDYIKYEENIDIDKSCLVLAYAISNESKASEVEVLDVRIEEEEKTSYETEANNKTSSSQELTSNKIESTTSQSEKPVNQRPTKPSGLQGVVDKSDNYNLFWTASENATYYNVYVDGEKIGNTVFANYRIPASYFAKSGDYKIEVEAVNNVGVSEKSSISYKVEIAEPTTTEKITAVEVTTKEVATDEVKTNEEIPTEPITEVIEPTSDNSQATTKDDVTDNIVAPTSKETKPVVIPTEKESDVYRVPAKASLKKLTNKKKKKVLVRWKLQRDCDGYQVQYSLNKKFTKKIKIKNITKASKDRITVKKLKLKNTYYFRIRAYKKYGTIKKFGDWSKYKRIKIKK